MPQICFYFQLHQPYRLRDLAVFDIGEDNDYFRDEDDRNKVIFDKVSRKSYIPMLTLLLRLTKEVPDFKFALSCSGIFLEQAFEYEPEVIELLQELAKTDQVEFLAETYYHSLAALYSPTEFATQVQMHVDYIQELFDYTPKVFRNTELIYSNDIAKQVTALGFQGMLTEAVERYLHGRPKTRVYRSSGDEALPLLLKHAEFSDDIAFRFSDKKWPEYPLTVEKYTSWLSGYYDEEIINLFMDFETFGEHQWEDTGIFTFFENFVKQVADSDRSKFVTPTEAILQATGHRQQASVQKQTLLQKITGFFKPFRRQTKEPERHLDPERSEGSKQDSSFLSDPLRMTDNKSHVLHSTTHLPVYNVPIPISWADVDRDLTAWIENPLQQDTLRALYALEERFKIQDSRIEIKKNLESNLLNHESVSLDTWRKLQTSDHFYYMCTKWAADGDVHAYFSPYESPYEAYRNYCVALGDLSTKAK